jgi:glycerol-3-phosphate dehydrogenase
VLAEVVIAARREQARSVADVLLRRTRLGLLAAPELRDRGAVESVARLLGEELGWSEARVAEEVEGWTRIAEAEGLDPARALAR